MSKLIGLPRINCITLHNAHERHASIIKQCQIHGLNYKLAIGYDGRDPVQLESFKVDGQYLHSMKQLELCITLSHLKAIYEWYHETQEEYGFFCEDDIDLSVSQYWPFNWQQFVQQLPKDWGVIQLTLLRDFNQDDINQYIKLTPYVWDNWSACAYILSRNYAKQLIDDYVLTTDSYSLFIKHYPDAIPFSENVIFNVDAKKSAYTIPLLTEVLHLESTFFPNFVDVPIRDNNLKQSQLVQSWWKHQGVHKNLNWFTSNQQYSNIIPVIGTAVVNNTKWVSRLISSIDYPVENLVIVNNNGRGELTQELDLIAKQPHEFIQKIHVVHMPSNVGVSTVWNLFIKWFMNAPYWIIMNDDVAFAPSLLAEFNSSAYNNPNVGLIHAYEGEYNTGSWDLFLIRDFVIQQYGLFDENLYPAYCEDADYLLRFIHNPISKIMNLSGQYYHGDGVKGEYHQHGSQTQKAEQHLIHKLDYANNLNIEYLTEKWGPNWRTQWPYEQGPFNKYPVNHTTYDLEFVRRKHLGF